MYRLAKDIHQPLSSESENSDDVEDNSNIAIAIIDEPTFIGKSTALLTFLRNRLARSPEPVPKPNPKLTFLVGLDTLERLFSPRYYPSEESMIRSLRHFFDQSEGEGEAR